MNSFFVKCRWCFSAGFFKKQTLTEVKRTELKFNTKKAFFVMYSVDMAQICKLNLIERLKSLSTEGGELIIYLRVVFFLHNYSSCQSLWLELRNCMSKAPPVGVYWFTPENKYRFLKIFTCSLTSNFQIKNTFFFFEKHEHLQQQQ